MKRYVAASSLVFALSLYLIAGRADRAIASLVASDNASNSPAYDSDSWDSGDNGGTGFGPWSFGSGGGGFIASGTSIDVGGNAFGVFGFAPDGIGDAIRSFTGDLLVGQTFSIDMDNQGVTASAVGFSLRNSIGENLFEFFFQFGSPNYKVNTLAGITETSTPFTSDGLNLSFKLTDADSFTLDIDLFSTGAGVDETVTGDLMASSDQGIEVLRLFNADSSGPDVFFNSMSISAVPEPSAFLFGGLICGILSLSYARRQRDLDLSV